MTEDEAKTKWCPHARIEGDGRNMEIMNGHTGPAVFCIGSACTAWRWERATSDAPSCVRYPGDEGSAADAHGFWYRNGKPTGFCGLAGRPE
jgi:hypothetical protein